MLCIHNILIIIIDIIVYNTNFPSPLSMNAILANMMDEKCYFIFCFYYTLITLKKACGFHFPAHK